MLFVLNILCDVIRDVIDKHVYIWQVMDVIDQTIGQFRKRLASVIAAKGGHAEQRFD